MDRDIHYMTLALDLAKQGLGRVWPNPSVGCVLVRNDSIIAQARTTDGGRPHAEALALASAGEAARGATAYVTLEPCHTRGRTGPCVDALIEAGIARVVIACLDPFQQKDGPGESIERLRAAGVDVQSGLCEPEAVQLNEGFFCKVLHGRPFVTAKLATTLDGRIALRDGTSRWITGEASRQDVHRLRASHDAILTGIGTVLADDPELTVRLPGHDYNPVRIVLDPSLKTPLSSRLARTAPHTPLWIITAPHSDPAQRQALQQAGARLIDCTLTDSLFDPAALLRLCAAEGLTRLMIEAGGRTLSSFLKPGLIDRLAWFRAPTIIGGDGIPAVGDLGLSSLPSGPAFTLESSRPVGGDILEIWRAVKLTE